MSLVFDSPHVDPRHPFVDVSLYPVWIPDLPGCADQRFSEQSGRLRPPLLETCGLPSISTPAATPDGVSRFSEPLRGLLPSACCVGCTDSANPRGSVLLLSGQTHCPASPVNALSQLVRGYLHGYAGSSRTVCPFVGNHCWTCFLRHGSLSPWNVPLMAVCRPSCVR